MAIFYLAIRTRLCQGDPLPLRRMYSIRSPQDTAHIFLKTLIRPEATRGRKALAMYKVLVRQAGNQRRLAGPGLSDEVHVRAGFGSFC